MSNASHAVDLPTHQQGREVSAPVTPPAMLALAIEKGASMEQLEKLMDMQERWEANEARKEYVAALNAFKADPPTVKKNKAASFGGGKTAYEYADLAQVANLIAPALSKYGLSHSWQINQTEANITVTCTLTHVMGHRESVSLSAQADTSGSKNAIQAIASTVTYLERYTLLAITGLAVEGMDNDADIASETITESQKSHILGIIQRFPNPEEVSERFCKWIGVAGLAAIPAKDFERGKAMLENKAKKELG